MLLIQAVTPPSFIANWQTHWSWQLEWLSQPQPTLSYKHLHVFPLAWCVIDWGHVLQDQIPTKSAPGPFVAPMTMPATEVVRHWMYYSLKWLWVEWFVFRKALCPAYIDFLDKWGTPTWQKGLSVYRRRASLTRNCCLVLIIRCFMRLFIRINKVED